MPLERAVQITGEVHEFMQSVAQDITKDGPLAWQPEVCGYARILHGVRGANDFREWRGGFGGNSASSGNHQADRVDAGARICAWIR